LKAIVGLGNPGAEYRNTRHNVGFEVVDALARRWAVRLRSWKSVADVAVVGARDAILVEPKTFMNLSGQAVRAVADYYRIAPADLLVIVDEVQLPLGRLRLRRSGSAGGHNGLKSVIEHVGAEFPRLRIGVERGDRRWDLADRVLSPFPASERDVVDAAIDRAADAAETFLSEGLEPAMSRFNAAEDRNGDSSAAIE
jgi:PTH1 family peptidyl-tRNA hydrolase